MRQGASGLTKTWCFRYMRKGVAHEMGLGRVALDSAQLDRVSLAEAREAALECRVMLRHGKEPLAIKQASIAVEAARVTFKDAAEAYLTDHGPAFKDQKKQTNIWQTSLTAYAYPHFGEKAVSDLTFEDVLAAITPIWHTKNETASRVRGRTEKILGYSTVKGWRVGDNPARWEGNLEHLLPSRSAVSPVQNRPAMAYKDVPAFMKRLILEDGVAAKALRFAILTACRTNEVLGADWSEFDLSSALWTVPAARMKGKKGSEKEHRVSLSKAALAILSTRGGDNPPTSGLVFPTTLKDEPLSYNAISEVLKRMNEKSITVHGFRSSFRDWAAEETEHPAEVAEMALAHKVANKVEAACRRGDLLKKRTAIMDDWAKFIA